MEKCLLPQVLTRIGFVVAGSHVSRVQIKWNIWALNHLTLLASRPDFSYFRLRNHIYINPVLSVMTGLRLVAWSCNCSVLEVRFGGFSDARSLNSRRCCNLAYLQDLRGVTCQRIRPTSGMGTL